MNKTILTGRPTRDPEIKHLDSENDSIIAKFSFAVNRAYKREEKSADFFNCVAFGRQARTVEKYVKKGTKLLLMGRMENNDYESEGIKVYGYNFIIETIEFVEKKNTGSTTVTEDEKGFMQIPEEYENEFPFQ